MMDEAEAYWILISWNSGPKCKVLFFYVVNESDFENSNGLNKDNKFSCYEI